MGLPKGSRQVSTKVKPYLSDPGVCDAVVQLLLEGKTLTSIAKMPNMPCRADLLTALSSGDELGKRITRAREDGMEGEAEEIRDLADSAQEENVQSTKLKIWARQWRLSKIRNSKYGADAALALARANAAAGATQEILLTNDPDAPADK